MNSLHYVSATFNPDWARRVLLVVDQLVVPLLSTQENYLPFEFQDILELDSSLIDLVPMTTTDFPFLSDDAEDRLVRAMKLEETRQKHESRYLGPWFDVDNNLIIKNRTFAKSKNVDRLYALSNKSGLLKTSSLLNENGSETISNLPESATNLILGILARENHQNLITNHEPYFAYESLRSIAPSGKQTTGEWNRALVDVKFVVDLPDYIDLLSAHEYVDLRARYGRVRAAVGAAMSQMTVMRSRRDTFSFQELEGCMGGHLRSIHSHMAKISSTYGQFSQTHNTRFGFKSLFEINARNYNPRAVSDLKNSDLHIVTAYECLNDEFYDSEYEYDDIDDGSVKAMQSDTFISNVTAVDPLPDFDLQKDAKVYGSTNGVEIFAAPERDLEWNRSIKLLF